MHRKKIVENGVVLETRDYLRGVELKDSLVDMVHFSEGFLKYRSGLNYVSNLNLTNTETQDKTYLAGTVISTSDITNQSKVSYLAEQTITMNNGFEVISNSEFAAVIDSSAQAFEDWEVYYTIKDHLGNTRIVVSDMNLDGGIDTSEMIQVSDYYPFGAEHSTSKTGDYAYRYNGKEKELGLDIGLLRYGARDMDPWTARFRGVDPIADAFPWVNPYNYAENSPIVNVDLHGLQKWNINSGVVYGPYRNQKSAENANINWLDIVPTSSGVNNQSGFKAGSLASDNFELSDNLGGVSAEGRFIGGSTKLNTSPLGLTIGAEGTLADAGGSLEMGSDLLGVNATAEGSLLSVQADLSLGSTTQADGSTFTGVEGNLGAFSAEGEVSFGSSILGIKTSVTLGGSVGSAHIGGKIGATYDPNSKYLSLEGMYHIGVVVGQKSAVKFEVPTFNLFEND